MDHPTSEDAEQAFYEAFRAGDLDAMRAVWAGHDSIHCIHPRGELLLGRDAVMDSWRQILAGGPVRVVAEPVSSSVGANLAVHLVTEQLLDEAGRVAGVVLATNVYELTGEGWRMLSHHAAPSRAPGTAARRPLH
jgi:ketosteroid isomerase-like protein